MQIGERQALDERAGFFELLFGFARETGHHIGADGAIRHQRASLQNAIGVVARAILAMHPAQHRIGTRLQRRVHMLGDARRAGDQFQQRIRPIHRLDRAEAQTFHRRFVEQAAHQIHQAAAAFEIAAPAAQVDPAEDHFTILRGEMAHLVDHGIRLRAAAAAAHVGNNAERAAIIASVLNLEIRTSAVAQGVFHGRGKKVALLENIADADLAVIVLAVGDQIGDRILVRVANDQTHAGQRGDFLGARWA